MMSRYRHDRRGSGDGYRRRSEVSRLDPARQRLLRHAIATVLLMAILAILIISFLVDRPVHPTCPAKHRSGSRICTTPL